MIAKASPPQYLLGLDLGPASIGWAVIALKDDEPVRIKAAGVRRFEAGVQGDIEGGRDESRANPPFGVSDGNPRLFPASERRIPFHASTGKNQPITYSGCVACPAANAKMWMALILLILS